jgi:pilus assembly protein CpaB
MKRRFVGVLAAIVLAVVGTIVLVAYVNGAEDRALAGEKTVDVLIVSQPIDQGTPANELEGKVEVKRVPTKVKADGVVNSLKQLRGLVASTALVPGEQVIRSRFVKPTDVASQRPSGATSSGDTSKLLKTTVALDPERAGGGRIKAGDTVAVTVTYKPDVRPYETDLILHKVPVTAVSLQSSGASKGGSTDQSNPDKAPQGKFLVTLALDAPSSERLVHAAETGTVWLSIEPKDADESGTRVVTPQSVFQ